MLSFEECTPLNTLIPPQGVDGSLNINQQRKSMKSSFRRNFLPGEESRVKKIIIVGIQTFSKVTKGKAKQFLQKDNDIPEVDGRKSHFNLRFLDITLIKRGFNMSRANYIVGRGCHYFNYTKV